jgi:hypothetical protein
MIQIKHIRVIGNMHHICKCWSNVLRPGVWSRSLEFLRCFKVVSYWVYPCEIIVLGVVSDCRERNAINCDTGKLSELHKDSVHFASQSKYYMRHVDGGLCVEGIWILM